MLKQLDQEPIKALLKGSNLTVALLLLAVLVSAVAVSYVGYENRRLHNIYQQELEKRNQAKLEWGKLLLQQSSLTALGRVERIAGEELDMEVPWAGKIEVVRP